MEKKDIAKLKEEAKEKAAQYEVQYGGCAQATLLALQETLEMEDEKVFQSATNLSGGMAFCGKFCGALAAGLMILGLRYGRADIKEEIPGIVRGIMPAYKLLARFEQDFGTTVCAEIQRGEGTPAITPPEEIFSQVIADIEGLRKVAATLHDRCKVVAGKTAEMVLDIIAAEEG